MRKIRRLAIYKSMKHHVISLMDEWHNNEHCQAVLGTSILSNEKELDICNSLSHYAHIADRLLGFDWKYEDREWVLHLLDFY